MITETLRECIDMVRNVLAETAFKIPIEQLQRLEAGQV